MAARLAWGCCYLLLWPAASGAAGGDGPAAEHLRALYVHTRHGGRLRAGADTARSFRASRARTPSSPAALGPGVRRPVANLQAAELKKRAAPKCSLLLLLLECKPCTKTISWHPQHFGRVGDNQAALASRCNGDCAALITKMNREIVAQKPLYCFNLTSLLDSELILAATFHFFSEKCSQHHKALCRCSKKSACHGLHSPLGLWRNVVFHSFGDNLAYGRLKESVAVFPHREEVWLVTDISHVIKRSRRLGELLLCAELDPGKKYRGVSEEAASHWPYILVYANDLAISELNSLAPSLQRYDLFPSAGSPLLSATTSTRTKRGTHPSTPVQNNELPGTVYHSKEHNEQDFWRHTYKSLKSKTPHRDRKRKGQEGAETLPKSQVLTFDEKTMREAQQKQWSEPAVCSRRHLKVDFADIGWNEWVIAPKSFEAYYCAGGCKFPMPKIVRPSNHATLQSIVKAVGIIPGIPEPGCVADTMNSLSVLFLDQSDNVVLKVYPNMSVGSCTCR